MRQEMLAMRKVKRSPLQTENQLSELTDCRFVVGDALLEHLSTSTLIL